jgi:hypothetical protein
MNFTAAIIAARLPFCSHAPRPQTHSPSSLYGAPSTILHGARRRAHGVADEHQTIAAGPSFQVQNQVAHVVDGRLQTGCFQLRLDYVADQRQHLRLFFQQGGLRTGVLQQLHRQPLRLVVRKIFFDQFFCGSRVHLNSFAALE